MITAEALLDNYWLQIIRNMKHFRWRHWPLHFKFAPLLSWVMSPIN